MPELMSNPIPRAPQPRRAAGFLGWAVLGSALLGLCDASLAAPTTAASVTIRQVGDNQTPNTQDFAGVGNNLLRGAAGEYTNTPATTSGTATAGGGKISTFASAFSTRSPAAGDPTSVATTSAASLSDSFTVSATGDAPISLEFALHALGSVTASNGDSRASRGGGFTKATASWQISLSGPQGAQSAAGSVAEQTTLVNTNPFTLAVVHTETGLGFDEFTMVVGLMPGAVGTTFSVSMLAEAAASINLGNGVVSALADFGSTLEWLGLSRATLQDGSPYLGTLSFTSESGFDYGKALATVPPVTVPEPQTYALMLVGLGALGASRWRLKSK